MYLRAVIVPPREVRADALVALQRALPEPTIEAPAPTARWARHRQAAAPVEPPTTLSGASEMVLMLARFGQLTNPDADRLAKSLAQASATWIGAEVHVAGFVLGEASHAESAGDQVEVSARLGGDTEGLRAIFANLNKIAMRNRFFLDRRNFRAEFNLGTLSPPSPGLAALERVSHRGPTWVVDEIALIRSAYDDRRDLHVYATLPLG